MFGIREKSRYLFMTWFFCGLAGLGLARPQHSASVDSLVSSYAAQNMVHGAVLVAEKGDVVYENAFGVANAAWEIPNSLQTRFKIYSMTKAFTAVLILQQAAEGRIDLDAPVSRYLPAYRRDVGDRVTLHQLLCHTHGISPPPKESMPYLIEDEAETAIGKYLSGDLMFEPGARFEYSGLVGYTLLGAVLEAVTGQSYEALIREKILNPLGMSETCYLNYHDIVPKKAEDYVLNQGVLKHRWQAYFAHANGASSLVTTVRDLLLWDRALSTDHLLPDEWRDKLFTPQATADQGAYGYGWYLWTHGQGEAARHFAFHSGGGSNLILRDLDQEITVILLNNVRSPLLMQIALEIINRVGTDRAL